jgi:transcriptional regulator with XRE-family HTH domain
MRFGQKIEKLCDARGWTKAELARRCRVSKTTAGRWFDDTRRPFDASLLRLARLFGVPSDFLVDDALDEPPAPEVTEEERTILRVIRVARIGPDEALEAITGWLRGRDASAPAVARLEPIEPRPAAGLVEITDQVTARETPRPTRPSPSRAGRKRR